LRLGVWSGGGRAVMLVLISFSGRMTRPLRQMALVNAGTDTVFTETDTGTDMATAT